MASLTTITAGDFLHREVVTCTDIAAGVTCRDGGTSLGLGCHLPIGINCGHIGVTACPVQGLVACIRRSHSRLDCVSIADIENTFAVIESNALHSLGYRHLGDRSKAIRSNQHLAVNSGFRRFCGSRHIRDNRGCDGAFAHANCRNHAVFIDRSNGFIAACIGQLDLSGVFRRHDGAKGLGVFTVQLQGHALRSGQALGKNHDLDMGGRTEIQLFSRHSDISFAGAYSRYHAGVVNRNHALIGAGPGQRQLLNGLGNLCSADIILSTILDFQQLALALLKNQVTRKTDIADIDPAAGQPQRHNHCEDERGHLRFHRLHAYIPFHLSCT